MVRTCEEFAESHNLKFSTDPNPLKCKTKTLAFLKAPRVLPKIYPCGNPLPWTEKFKHLGVTIGNKIDGCYQDIPIKNAQYISKNIELNQEFHFAHPLTKLKLNQIHNSHYYGSPLWDLFGTGAIKVESSYNKSVKAMLDLPIATHRNLIEPLTSETHIKIVLIRRFLSFVEKIRNSGKPALEMLLSEAASDVRSTTGSNLRNIMLLAGKTSIDAVSVPDADKIEYFKLEDEDTWKVTLATELIEAKANSKEIPGFNDIELDTILNYICTQ